MIGTLRVSAREESALSYGKTVKKTTACGSRGNFKEHTGKRRNAGLYGEEVSRTYP
jgi:hypothetical protein